MKRKIGILAVIMVAVLCVAACATINALVTEKELTPEARYYDALVSFNDNVERYLAVYDLAKPETKAKWKAQIDPLIRAASSALDTWKGSLEAPDQEQLFKDAFRALVTALVTSGIVKVEE